ncbi:hypothetical protein EYC59_06080 [Candidatus Saccharibacteria bacterium]|nr:MAG: hypothetical protein EYC59_06080 [Candidatus Saccharibacteria bacterium]
MARLPTPGSDDGAWGDILNDFLAQSHAGDGTLKPGTVHASTIADGTITEAKLDTAAQTKLNSSVTNLSASRNGTSVTVVSSTGADAVIAAADNTDAGVLTASDKVKLDGIASAATANATDAQLRDRTTHTGTQAISTITGLQTALDNKAETGDITSHEAAADPHATAGYAIMLGGGRRIFVQSTDPGGAASDGDLWIDTA